MIVFLKLIGVLIVICFFIGSLLESSSPTHGLGGYMGMVFAIFLMMIVICPSVKVFGIIIMIIYKSFFISIAVIIFLAGFTKVFDADAMETILDFKKITYNRHNSVLDKLMGGVLMVIGIIIMIFAIYIAPLEIFLNDRIDMMIDNLQKLKENTPQ